MIIIRLVCHDDPLSKAILKVTGGEVAHAEAVMFGGTIIGAFAEGGVQERKLDYDGGKFLKEILLALPADAEMAAKFEHWLRACLGEAYDFTGLTGFALPTVDMHRAHHAVCSMLIHNALRGCQFFFRPMPIPAHKVDPVLLQQELLARTDVQVISREDPLFIAHIAQAPSG
jgi:hypothetical protein